MKKNFATQAILIMLLDALALTVAGGIAFLLRFDSIGAAIRDSSTAIL